MPLVHITSLHRVHYSRRLLQKTVSENCVTDHQHLRNSCYAILNMLNNNEQLLYSIVYAPVTILRCMNTDRLSCHARRTFRLHYCKRGRGLCRRHAKPVTRLDAAFQACGRAPASGGTTIYGEGGSQMWPANGCDRTQTQMSWGCLLYTSEQQFIIFYI